MPYKDPSPPRRMLRATVTIQTWDRIKKHLFNPPPSNLVFYLLIASNLWFAFQVQVQGVIIKNQMILLDYYVRSVFQR